MTSPEISIVLPVYQESEHIADTIQTISDILKTITDSYEFVLVDDGSNDNTWDVIKDLHQKDSSVKGVSLSRNFGKERALLAGIEACNGQAVIVMDADLQHPPELIPDMYRAWKEDGFNIVNARKSHRGKENILYGWAARAFYRAYKRLTGVSLHGASDYKLLDRKVADIYSSMKERNLFFRGLIAWMGFQQKDINFEVQARVAGERKWPKFKLFLLAVNAITSFSTLPLQFVTGFGFLTLILAFWMGVDTVMTWARGDAVAGFSTVILLLLFLGSLLMISLGIIGQYLAKIYQEIKDRPQYLIQEKIGFTEDGE